MAGFVGIVVSDPWLQNHFTQVELRTLKSRFLSIQKENSKSKNENFSLKDLSLALANLKLAPLTEEETLLFLQENFKELENQQLDFEQFLRVYLKIQGRNGTKGSATSAFLKAATTTLLHTISESEKTAYVNHINGYLSEDEFMKKYLPIDALTDDLFKICKEGVLLCKLINVAVPGTIDERAINTKTILNPWEKNENHTLCLNSAKAIGCTLVNIGTQDLAEGRTHLVLGLISQIIKIQLLADVNLKKTPQLVELVGNSEEAAELMSLPPEKILLRWLNFQLKKGGLSRQVSNFSSDVQDSEAYACLLSVLAPELKKRPYPMEVKNLLERAKLVLEHADRMGCKRFLSPKDIVDGSPNLNLAFVAHIFSKRNGLSKQMRQMSFGDVQFEEDDSLVSREERAFRLWMNSLGISTYINNVFEDLRNGWLLLETLDKVHPGMVNWKLANKPPIKLPFKKMENCNQVIKIGKELKFSLVNVAGNDIVQGNKKLILAFLWQLMRYNILQLLKNLRLHSNGKEITDGDILTWANNQVKSSGKFSRMESFKDKSLSSGIFFLNLLSAVENRVVNWSLVTAGQKDDEKKMNASYIISIARKLGCSIFLLPEDILEVNQKMMLTLTASIMYWHLKRPSNYDQSNFETASLTESNLSSTSDDSASDSSIDDNGSR
ncbi:hypothetical protein LUZ60_002109 [Juncus effusus]|nr:hypothetical protein LUZ60_002109 [Juncus effusus]